MAGIAVLLVYTYYYPNRDDADIFRYFDDAKQIYKALPEKPLDFLQMIVGVGNNSPYFEANYYENMNYWSREYSTNIVPDSHLIICFNALIMLLSFGYFNVHTIFACFFSFIGLMALCRFIENNIKNVHWGHIASIFLIPSVVFWSSNNLKEFMLIFAIGLILFLTDELFCKKNTLLKKIIYTILICLCFIILIFTKIYLSLLLFMLLIPFILIKKFRIQQQFLCYIASICFFSVCLYFFFTLKGYNALELIAFKHNDMLDLALQNNAQITDCRILNNNLLDICSYLPLAIFNVLFRPLPLESFSPMMLIAELEILFLVLMSAILLILGFKKPTDNKNIFLLCLFFAFSNIAIIGISSPIIGAFVRYRIIELPFLMLGIWLLCDKDMVKRKLKIY